MKKEILLMDPDELVRESMSMFLGDLGYCVMTSGNAKDGLVCLREKKCDAIVCASQLPDMDGLQFIRKIQELYPEMLKVLECDSCGSMEFFNEARVAGVNEIIHKPYTATDLEKMVFRLKRKYWNPENFRQSADL